MPFLSGSEQSTENGDFPTRMVWTFGVIPHGRYIQVGGGQSNVVAGLRAAVLLKQLEGHKGKVRCVMFVADRRQLFPLPNTNKFLYRVETNPLISALERHDNYPWCEVLHSLTLTIFWLTVLHSEILGHGGEIADQIICSLQCRLDSCFMCRRKRKQLSV